MGGGGGGAVTLEARNVVRCSWMVTSSGTSGTVAPRAAMNMNATHWKRINNQIRVDSEYSPTSSS